MYNQPSARDLQGSPKNKLTTPIRQAAAAQRSECRVTGRRMGALMLRAAGADAVLLVWIAAGLPFHNWRFRAGSSLPLRGRLRCSHPLHVQRASNSSSAAWGEGHGDEGWLGFCGEVRRGGAASAGA